MLMHYLMLSNVCTEMRKFGVYVCFNAGLQSNYLSPIHPSFVKIFEELG